MLAALFLQAKLYRIIDRRYKTRLGEIDLVAERWGTIVFVEVKARKHAGSERDTLQAVNRRRIVRAAELWCARHRRYDGFDIRYDVIFLAPGRWPRHVTNAFDAS